MAKRIQRKRVSGWRKPPGAVSVCRPGRWGNPFPVGKPAKDVPLEYRGHVCKTAREAVSMYLKWVKKYGLPLQCDLAEIEGRDLMCWCSEGSACHGDALLEMANMGGIEAYFRRRDMETMVCHCHRCGTDWLNEEILPTGACPLCPEYTGVHASLSVPVLPRDARVIDDMCSNIEARRAGRIDVGGGQ